MIRTNEIYIIGNWLFFAIVMTIGILNLVLVHPVPGIVFIMLSLIYFPPLISVIKFTIPTLIKVALGFVIIWFTLGISDLGEIIGF